MDFIRKRVEKHVLPFITRPVGLRWITWDAKHTFRSFAFHLSLALLFVVRPWPPCGTGPAGAASR